MPGIDTSTRALGWFSLGLGTAQVLAPRAIARLAGFRGDPAGDRLTRAVGVRELAAGVGLLTRQQSAVWLWSRVAGDAMDLALLTLGMSDPRNHPGRVGSALAAVAGVTVADLRTAQAASGENAEGALHLTKALTINRPVNEVYQFWRDFRHFPQFMSHLESVAVLDAHRSHWTAHGPAGRFVEWDAEITEDVPGHAIAWRSLPGADVENSGRVQFSPAPGNRGTEVRVEMDYAPPAGALGEAFASLFGQAARQQVQADLRKLKQVLETGEVIRSAATVHGTQYLQRPAQPLPESEAMGARA